MSRSRVASACLVAVLVSIRIAPFASARTWRVPAEQLTIGSALAAAEDGDSVLVAPGEYRGDGNRDLDFAGKRLALVSEAGPSATVIDAEQKGRCLGFETGDSREALVDGFTLLGGNAAYGGSIRCTESAPRIRRCWIIQNAAAAGGGVFISGGAPELEDCRIAGNLGGGLHVQGGDVVLSGCVITGNRSERGSGIWLDASSSARLTSCTIASNAASSSGGGLYASSGSTAELTLVLVWGNCAPAEADIALAAGCDATVTCSVLDRDRVGGAGLLSAIEVMSLDPKLCGPTACDAAPTPAGNYGLASTSPALATDCAPSIGAMGAACEVAPVEVSTWGRVKARYADPP